MNGAVRLRPLVEILRTDSAVWLLRGPAGGDARIARPSESAVALLELLADDGGTPERLVAALGERGIDAGVDEIRDGLATLESAGMLEPADDYADDERLARQLLYLRDRRPAGAAARSMQAAVSTARVAVIGCGGLGSWAAAGLACIGVGQLTLVDGDVVERSNLNRQLLFRERDVGRPKVDAAAETLRGFDEQLDVRPVHRFLKSPDAVRACVAGHDFVIACADQPAYEIARWIGDACVREGIPHIGAGQLPPVIRVGPLVIPHRTACVRCLEAALREENPLYDQLEAQRARDQRPHATLGPASGIVGQVIASEVLHHLTGLCPPATLGAAWTLDMRTLTSESTPVRRRDDCRVCGEAPARVLPA